MKLKHRVYHSLTPLGKRRLDTFKANRRALISFYLLLFMFIASLLAEVIANDKPLLVQYDDSIYFPIIKTYPETTFGGFFETETQYDDPYVIELIEEKGFIVWPPIPFSYTTVVPNLEHPAPSAPSNRNWLGTDDQGRDVLARVIYGFRLSIMFGLLFTIISSVIGIAVGALQGYYGGKVDLFGQRILEIWSGMPELYVLIILASLLKPSFGILLFVMLLFGWPTLVSLVRAEFLRARNFDYVRAAKALGVKNHTIILRHVLPNALVATMTYVPFIFAGSISTLAALDFLGLGLPPGAPSLGELLLQGKSNLHAPWLGITAFTVMSSLLALVVFVGEGVRDAFDPKLSV